MMQLAQGFPLEILPLREMLTGIIEDFKLQVLFLCWSYRQEQTMALQQQMEVGLVHETMQLGVCRGVENFCQDSAQQIRDFPPQTGCISFPVLHILLAHIAPTLSNSSDKLDIHTNVSLEIFDHKAPFFKKIHPWVPPHHLPLKR